MQINKLIVLFLVLPASVFGMQTISINEAQPIRVVVSQNDINLLSIKNDRIESIALPNSVEVEKNNKNGSAFVRFKSNSIVKGFLTTESGSKYQLEFVPSNIGSETIVLVAPTLKSPDAVDAREYTQMLAVLLRAMYNESEIEGYVRTITDKRVKINNNKLDLEASYIGAAIDGQVLSFKNTGDKELLLKEIDFYDTGVRSVAIVDKNLSAGARTKVFIMRDKI
jgi:type-F conjugative transfer system secretin TraK